jgi:hypothetical protein
MTVQTINIGNQVNDGLGDDLRTAFQKVNANFADLSTQLTITGANTGEVGSGVFKQKVGTELQFKKLVSGTKMFIDEQADTITINNTAPFAFFRFDTNAGSITAGSGNSNGQITIQGGDDIDVTASGSVITIDNVIPVTNILTTFDFGFISGLFTNTAQLALAASNIDFGTITLPGTLNLDCGSIL